jgi:ferrous iron transport protein B
MTLVDLPGSYSLQVRSPDEAVARDVLLGRLSGEPRPDVVVAVVDACNLERNLYLVVQMLELGLPVVLVLNMVDMAEKAGIRIDPGVLEERLGVPVVPMVAVSGKGMVELRQALSRQSLPAPARRAPMPELLRVEMSELAGRLESKAAEAEALLLLAVHGESGEESGRYDAQILKAVREAQERLRAHGLDPVSAPVDARYAWIQEICDAAVKRPEQPALGWSDRLDGFLTHPVWGWLAFLGTLGLMFFCIFWVAQKPMDWIDAGFGLLGDWIGGRVPEGDFRSLLVDGVVAGVGGVVIFLPQILILYFFLGLLEDSGYMARAAFLMDRLMSRVGLHGKSFIPLLSSFACAIPGIMATRTIETRKDRLVTMLVAPLMSCSARLPVYSLMIAVLLPAAAVWQKVGLMVAMYMLGVVAAFTMAWVFKKTLLRSETPMLLLEMPPYRWPAPRSIALRMLERAGIFLRRAGTVILALSVLLWALATYPKPAHPDATPAEAIAQSFAGRMGHAMEPLIRPLGYDWKIGIGLVGSFAAREVFVGTMKIVYNLEDNGEDDEPLRDTMREEKRENGMPVYTPLVCIGLMVFYVLAMQCVSTLAIVYRESNGWRWPLFQLAYMTLLAYAAALLVYQGGRLLGFQ